MSNIKDVEQETETEQGKQDDSVQDAVAKIKEAQLSITEKKARFKRMRDDGARLTKHRFTL